MRTNTEIWAYPARLTSHDEGEWVATFDDFPEALTGANDRREALAAAADALEETVLAYIAAGRDIPAPRGASESEELVVLDVVTAARAALARTMKARGIGATALARRMGKSEGAVRRLFDGGTRVKVDTVLEALAAASMFQHEEGERARPALALVG